MVYEDTNFCFSNTRRTGGLKRGFYITKNFDLSKSIFVPNINFNYLSVCTKDNKSMMMR